MIKLEKRQLNKTKNENKIIMKHISKL